MQKFSVARIFIYDSPWEGFTVSQSLEEEGICVQGINLDWIFMKERIPTMWILPVLEQEIVLESKVAPKYVIMIMEFQSSKYKKAGMQID